MDSSADWKAIATTCRTCATEMRTARRPQAGGNVFAIKVSDEDLIFRNFLSEEEKMVMKKIIGVVKTTSLVQQTVPPPCPPPPQPNQNLLQVRCPPCPKPSLLWRSLRFGNKLLVAGCLVYYTGSRGAWGTPEESLEFVSNISEHIRILLPYHISSFIWDDK